MPPSSFRYLRNARYISRINQSALPPDRQSKILHLEHCLAPEVNQTISVSHFVDSSSCFAQGTIHDEHQNENNLSARHRAQKKTAAKTS